MLQKFELVDYDPKNCNKTNTLLRELVFGNSSFQNTSIMKTSPFKSIDEKMIAYMMMLDGFIDYYSTLTDNWELIRLCKSIANVPEYYDDKYIGDCVRKIMTSINFYLYDPVFEKYGSKCNPKACAALAICRKIVANEGVVGNDKEKFLESIERPINMRLKESETFNEYLRKMIVETNHLKFLLDYYHASRSMYDPRCYFMDLLVK